MEGSLFTFLLLGVMMIGDGVVTSSDPEARCPSMCVCEDAPLRTSPFVLTWMTSWGEDDMPEMSPNEVLLAEDVVSSLTAKDAGVDVDVVGLHSTCALMPGVNLTKLLLALPPHIMVLSILQAAGTNLTVLESRHLSHLTKLRALHLQGFMHRSLVQVSGYTPNTIRGIIDHKEVVAKALLQEEPQENLTLALAEDALNHLANLELLDLQFVRLVGSLDSERQRRHTVVKPIATSTLLDMSLSDFLSLTNSVPGLKIPAELHPNRTSESIASKDVDTRQPPSHGKYVSSDIELVLLNNDDEDVVSYDRYKEEKEKVMAPFICQTNLKYLRVAHAKLDHVGPELLSGLGRLHTLTLEYNHIKILPEAMFTPTPKLRHLSLAHNSLLELDAASLNSLDSLLTLDLDHNKLDVLGPNSFPYIPTLSSLRLLENPLTHILPFTFSKVNSTVSLLLGSGYNSVELHRDTFRHLSNLEVLRVENVSILSLSRFMLDGMPNLQDLTIHGHISGIDYDSFTATPHLTSLTLSHSHLQRLSVDAFIGLKSLRVLDLSHNNLVELSPGTFEPLVSLREMYLHHNDLSTLPPGIFGTLHMAKLIQVHANPWHCTCALLQLRSTITNKVRRGSSRTCQWDERKGTVCVNNDPKRIVYDSRVAPLCHSPTQHSHQDVFHVTVRNLKCTKQRTHKKQQVEKNDIANKILPVTPIQVINEIGKSYAEKKPASLSTVDDDDEVKDLLMIAEAEMPAEAYAPMSQEEINSENQNNHEINNLKGELEDEEELDEIEELEENVFGDGKNKQNMIYKFVLASVKKQEQQYVGTITELLQSTTQKNYKIQDIIKNQDNATQAYDLSTQPGHLASIGMTSVTNTNEQRYILNNVSGVTKFNKKKQLLAQNKSKIWLKAQYAQEKQKFKATQEEERESERKRKMIELKELQKLLKSDNRIMNQNATN